MEKYNGVGRDDNNQQSESWQIDSGNEDMEFDQAMYPVSSVPTLEVPKHLYRHFIKDMPTDTVYWLDPDENDDEDIWGDDTYNVFVDKSQHLYLDGSKELHDEMTRPKSLIGKIGVMAVRALESELNGDSKLIYLADLRFIGRDSLSQDDIEDASDDQEEANDYYRWKNELRQVQGFITRSDMPSEYDDNLLEARIADLRYDKYYDSAEANIIPSALDQLADKSNRLADDIADDNKEEVESEDAESPSPILSGNGLTATDLAKFRQSNSR